jgi:hypothetical protein
VLVATEPDGSPVLLLSALAWHTRNLLADPRASLLVDGTDGLGDPLAGGRISLMGEVKPTQEPGARHRFLARHPSAAGYADFKDFGFYRFEPANAHLILGFGRIIDLPAAALLTDLTGAGELVAGGARLCEELGQLDLPGGAATRPARGPWRITGVDPAGCDLACGDQALRLTFERPVRTIAEARAAIAARLAAGRP